MGRYFKIHHFILLAPLLFLYGNCGGYKSSDGSQSSVLANCTNSASLSLKLLNFNSHRDCENHQLIHCEKRVFGPAEESKVETRETCLSNSAYGDLCLAVVERAYNTLGASDQEEEYQVGGPYNYEEVNCYMGRFTHNNRPIFRSSEPTLVASLAALHQQCVQGDEP